MLTAISVLSYSTSKAALCLGHAYPQGTSVTVSVNVELVLRSADHELTRVGEWVNVVGYITSKPSSARLGPQNVDDLPLEVQALLLWPTGPLDVHMYEQSLEDRPVDRGT